MCQVVHSTRQCTVMHACPGRTKPSSFACTPPQSTRHSPQHAIQPPTNVVRPAHSMQQNAWCKYSHSMRMTWFARAVHPPCIPCHIPGCPPELPSTVAMPACAVVARLLHPLARHKSRAHCCMPPAKKAHTRSAATCEQPDKAHRPQRSMPSGSPQVWCAAHNAESGVMRMLAVHTVHM